MKFVEGYKKFNAKEILDPLAITIDPLDLPICSYELNIFIIQLIKLSKYLNNKYQLPKSNQHIMCSWNVIYKRMINNQNNLMDCKQNQSILILVKRFNIYFNTIITMIKENFRFNLRFLARFDIFLIIIWILLYISTKLLLISLSKLVISTLVILVSYVYLCMH